MEVFDANDSDRFFTRQSVLTAFTCWDDLPYIPNFYGSGIIVPTKDMTFSVALFVTAGSFYVGTISYSSKTTSWRTVQYS